MNRTFAILMARARTLLVLVVLAVALADARWALLPGPFLVAWAISVALIITVQRVGTLTCEPVEVVVPVLGRWRAHNSPASRVPSHGVQSYGQGYAIDLVADPADGSRPGFGWLPLARRPRDYPGFGRPVHAPCDGTVARAHDRERDHLSRSSPLGLVFLFTVELLRDLFGPNRVLGNHVTIDRGDGTYVVLAHLERDSVQVRPGQRVVAGEAIARCGNSGNSSEPHLHLQIMEHPRPHLAAGVPFRLVGADGAPLATPPNGTHLETAQR